MKKTKVKKDMFGLFLAYLCFVAGVAFSFFSMNQLQADHMLGFLLAAFMQVMFFLIGCRKIFDSVAYEESQK